MEQTEKLGKEVNERFDKGMSMIENAIERLVPREDDNAAEDHIKQMNAALQLLESTEKRMIKVRNDDYETEEEKKETIEDAQLGLDTARELFKQVSQKVKKQRSGL